MTTITDTPAPTPGELADALVALVGGDTSAILAARAANTRHWDRYRTAEGLATLHPANILWYVPSNELADAKQAEAARQAEAAAALEDAGWTPETARAALREHNAYEIVAKDGWTTHRSCSACAPCSGNCGCPCHSPVSTLPALAMVPA